MFIALIEKLLRHEDLTAEEASAAMQQVMDGNAPPAALAGLLSALAMKGERPAEIVGFARTVTAKAKDKVSAGDYMAKRMDYLDYVASEPRPTIAVIEDLDDEVGYGAFWGEVQSNVHKALGCLGVITDGSIRDIPQWAPGFQALAGSIGPSHAWVHAEHWGGEVRVAGMTVHSDDLIHADQHGAIVIPVDIAAKIPEAAELCGRRETPILDIARSPDFTLEKLKEALKRSSEIH